MQDFGLGSPHAGWLNRGRAADERLLRGQVATRTRHHCSGTRCQLVDGDPGARSRRKHRSGLHRDAPGDIWCAMVFVRHRPHVVATRHSRRSLGVDQSVDSRGAPLASEDSPPGHQRLHHLAGQHLVASVTPSPWDSTSDRHGRPHRFPHLVCLDVRRPKSRVLVIDRNPVDRRSPLHSMADCPTWWTPPVMTAAPAQRRSTSGLGNFAPSGIHLCLAMSGQARRPRQALTER